MFTNIDRVFCINLKTSTDRKENFKSNFPELVKSGIFEWYGAERDTENPKRGCYNSHKNILELSKKRGYKQILIFEDDASPIVEWNVLVKTVNNIKYPEYWRAIQIGYFPLSTKKINDNDTLVEIACSITTHSYIANVDTLDLIPFFNKEVDMVMFCSNFFENYFLNFSVPGMYGIYPHILTKQGSSGSTISKQRDNQGVLNFDRDIILQMSHFNYTLFFIIIIILLISLTITAIVGIYRRKN